eukprot:12813786-Alexandrium_andersonii.AAC.1
MVIGRTFAPCPGVVASAARCAVIRSATWIVSQEVRARTLLLDAMGGARARRSILAWWRHLAVCLSFLHRWA